LVRIEESVANTPVRFLRKLTAQVLLHLGRGAGAINGHHQLFPAKQLQDGLRFGMTILQACLYGFRCVVGAGDQHGATNIAGVGHCGSVEDQVVMQATCRAEPAVEDARLNHGIGDLDQ
jgi:hypothetical protein